MSEKGTKRRTTGTKHAVAKGRSATESQSGKKEEKPPYGGFPFTFNIHVHVRDMGTGNGIVGAVVEVDPRGGGHDDPDPDQTSADGSDAVASFYNIHTNGPAIYDIDVTATGYFPDYKRVSILSSQTVDVYFYLESV